MGIDGAGAQPVVDALERANEVVSTALDETRVIVWTRRYLRIGLANATRLRGSVRANAKGELVMDSSTPPVEEAEGYRPIPLEFERLPLDVSLERSRAFLETMRKRRSIRSFSSEPVPLS